MERVVTERVAGVDYFAKVLTVMSGLALVLALTGMYSLMAYLSARRTKEVGLRLALGATKQQVTWLAAIRARHGSLPAALARRHRDGGGARPVHAVGALRAGRRRACSSSPPRVILALVTMAAGSAGAYGAGQDPGWRCRTE